MQLFIVRHAQSANNSLIDARHRVHDPDLTALGRRQAEIVARHLAHGRSLEPYNPLTGATGTQGYRLTHLYCSPMWRSLLTARAISQATGLVPEVWIDIHEHGGMYLDHGAEQGLVGYPGKTRQEILAEFPGYVLPAAITERGWWTQGFEERDAGWERAGRVAEILRGRAAHDEQIALVSHGDFIDDLLKALLRQPPGRHHYYYHFNTALSRLDFHADGHLEVIYMNRVEHLPSELIS
ncbi:MAG: histidine phosphatase family protein [Chloroflexi bacterium]|nr:histidine phosphatase family protein [Chloroflexota bacterium]